LSVVGAGLGRRQWCGLAEREDVLGERDPAIAQPALEPIAKQRTDRLTAP
jgi:hypothetical protein